MSKPKAKVRKKTLTTTLVGKVFLVIKNSLNDANINGARVEFLGSMISFNTACFVNTAKHSVNSGNAVSVATKWIRRRPA